eukprot:SAG22_NODE_1292_length_4851_cov_4.982323_1_plen_74_part_00
MSPEGARAGGQRSLSGVWRAMGDGLEEMFVLQQDGATGEISGGHVEGAAAFFLIKDGLVVGDMVSFTQFSAAG